mgnify:CR=1 FL=1
MISKEIKYNIPVRYRGKNSGYKQMGIAIFNQGDRLKFYPIHSKDGYGDGFMEIPKENVQELIDALKLFL